MDARPPRLLTAALVVAMLVGWSVADALSESTACRVEAVPRRAGTFGIGGHGNLLAFGDGAVWTLIERGPTELARIARGLREPLAIRGA